jgi:hypothetical protein
VVLIGAVRLRASASIASYQRGGAHSGTAFTKTEGCNKMTCRCGALMCYICRKAIKTTDGKKAYNHFCQHPRNPGQGCSKCKKCSLWSSAEEDDDLKVKEAKEKAKKEVGHQLAAGIKVG